MKFLNHPSRSAIGLDVGGRHANAAQLEKADTASGWRLAAVAHFPRTRVSGDLTSDDVHEVAEVLFRRGFSGHRVVIAVPNEKLLSGVLDVPARAANVPVEQIARMELARTCRCSPDSFEMGCWDLPAPARAKRNAQVMAVGCAHQEANAFLDIFESAGLDVKALDVRACALARAAAPLMPAEKAVWAVLDLGWSSGMLVMLYGDAVVYTRTLSDSGVKSLHESLKKRCGLDSDVTDYLLSEANARDMADAALPSGESLPPEARGVLAAYLESLTHELKISLTYVSHEYSDTPINRLLLTGSSATMPGLAGHLSGELGLEARAVTAAELCECPPALLEAASSPALIAAIGLAQFTEGR